MQLRNTNRQSVVVVFTVAVKDNLLFIRLYVNLLLARSKSAQHQPPGSLHLLQPDF